MSIEARPTDTITKNNLFVGMPFILFERKLASGAFDTPRNLGIIDSAELQKTIEVLQLTNKQSGITVLEKEAIGRIEPRLQIGIFNFEPANMRYFLASKSLTEVSSSTVVVTDDEVTVPSLFPNEYAPLSNALITTEPLTDLDPKTVTSEAVGTGDGSSNAFALDFPVLVVGDLTTITVGGVTYTPIAVSAAATGNEVEVVVGAVATSGNLEFFVGGSTTPPPNGDAIVATYTSTMTFTSGTDYTLDPTDGRIRFLDTDKVRIGQILEADYSYTQLDETTFVPFTQGSFEGRVTIKQLTGLGVNFIWDIPSASIRLNDDPFAWNADDFATGTITMNILSVGGCAPFGTWRHFPETPDVC